MKSLYVIRNTTAGCDNNEHNLYHLRTIIEQHVAVVCDVIVINSTEQSFEFTNVINLDPFSRIPEHYPLDICRNFSTNDKKIGYSSRTNISIEDQISQIPLGNYYLLDDDIMTGGTCTFVKSVLPEGINIIGDISLLHYTLSKNFDCYNVVDCIDTHDFWGGFPTSGLNINGERHYYQSELVDIEKRASVKNGAIVKQYLNAHIIN